MDELIPTPPSQPTNDPSNNPQVDPIVTPSPSPSPHKRHHPTPGGPIYLFTLLGSKDWISKNGKQIYKFGYTTEDNLDDYLRTKQRNHPTKPIILACAYKLPSGVKTAEKDILSEIEKQGHRYYTNSTANSEYVVNRDECIKIIENFETNRWEEVEESKFF